eukprot:m.61469 g.61469  ORF g.61469 m.61469 type:complete len:76 (+) comp7991_c7_seq1:2033-2260(+)
MYRIQDFPQITRNKNKHNNRRRRKKNISFTPCLVKPHKHPANQLFICNYSSHYSCSWLSPTDISRISIILLKEIG